MGNLINPIGGRLNVLTFWPAVWPIAYAQNEQVHYFQLSLHLRFLVRLALYRIFAYNPHHHERTVLHGLLLQFVMSVWGATFSRLSVYVNLFDYKLVARLFALRRPRFHLQQLFGQLRYFATWRSRLRGRPRSGLSSRLRFLPRLIGQVLSPFWLRASLHSHLTRYIRRGLRYVFRLFHRRVGLWHRNFIAITYPYLHTLCRTFSFTRCFFFTRIVKSSLTAGMIARYLVLKVRQGFRLNLIVRGIRRALFKFGMRFFGYKLCLSGRFTRKQIATYTWYRAGSVTLNQRVSGVDYVQDYGFSKFGLFGIKLWLFRQPALVVTSFRQA